MNTKKTNRELALEYLKKAKEEDAKKIKAFTDACFTDDVLNMLASYTKTDFKKIGLKLSPKMKSFFLSFYQTTSALKQTQPEKKTPQPRTADVSSDTEKTDDLSKFFPAN